MHNLPSVTKNILLANLLVWLLDVLLQRYGVDLAQIFGLHYFGAPHFYIWQLLTYMFMHGSFSHIFCNMFAVLIFAPLLEKEWGAKKFFIYYLITGVGAGLIQEATWALALQPYVNSPIIDQFITIGASGAVFGILFAFGWLFPNIPLFIMFIPIPIRARTFVIIYALIELFAGLSNAAGDNVAHFAHLGGMLFGWLVILWWKHSPKWFRSLHHPSEDDGRHDNDYSDYHYRKNVE